MSAQLISRDPDSVTLIGRYESRLSRDFACTLAQLHQLQKGANKPNLPTEPRCRCGAWPVTKEMVAKSLPTPLKFPPNKPNPLHPPYRHGATPAMAGVQIEPQSIRHAMRFSPNKPNPHAKHPTTRC